MNSVNQQIEQSQQLNKNTPYSCYSNRSIIRELQFSVIIDDHRIRGQFIDSLPFAVKFSTENIDFIVQPDVDKMDNIVVLLYGRAQYELSEWKYTAQLRIKTGSAEKQQGVRVVDKLLVEFGNRIPPLSLNVTDTKVKRIKFEMRLINKLYEQLPTFQSGGDVILLFEENEKLYVDKALLAIHSRYMASMLHDAAPNAIIDMCLFDRNDFLELLYQIYATNRPISANLFALSRAAISYKADIILARITKFISNLDMDIISKFQLSIQLELDNTLIELVYDAEQRGIWRELIEQGFEPKSLGTEIYHRIICPAIIKARQHRLGANPYISHLQFNFHMQQYPYTVPLLIPGQTLYVNRGILSLYNINIYDDLEDGYFLRITSKLMTSCTNAGITITDLILKMLQYMYPSQTVVPGPYIRPMMLLAEEHGMKRLLNNLCEMLALEPTLSPTTMLEHFELANRYHHLNLLNANLIRMEGSFKRKVGEMVALEKFDELPDEIQQQILDRLYSGWALNDQRLANVPTTNMERTITLNSGGSKPNEYENDPNLLTFQGMKTADAFGSMEEINITDA
ncbi:b52-prov protein, putative [Brugia malayi]|uniref:B52-prov protein, putative n=1 Tax=Brugia malayi TaxID=6279 RepID=A0A1P6CEE6_BRUMA|nr:b52-prov protein, putative [Brugia malayi]CDP92110.1 Bm8849 [Brugia malayi]VIO93081.1 b52-prov protein, putative [Brugia malayi]